MAMQDQEKALESKNENLKQRIDQLESEHDYNQSSRGGAVMNNYVDDMGNKSYLSSEMM
jgi:cell division protein FtsB